MESRVRAYLEHLPRDIDRWLAFVRQRAPRTLGCSIDPEDILGAAVVRALRYAGGSRAESEPELEAWLRRIICNVISHLVRQQARREDVLRSWASARRVVMPGSPEFERRRGDEVLHRLRDALEHLSAERAELVNERVFEQRSFAEAASRRGITEGAARSRFYRIRKHLEEQVLGKEGRRKEDGRKTEGRRKEDGRKTEGRRKEDGRKTEGRRKEDGRKTEARAGPPLTHGATLRSKLMCLSSRGARVRRSNRRFAPPSVQTGNLVPAAPRRGVPEARTGRPMGYRR